MDAAQCEQRLLEGTKIIDPILNPLGFVFGITDSGKSSPGPYAVGYYKNGNKKIGLIFRSGGLGAIEYTYHQAGYQNSEAGTVHRSLMRYFDKQDVCKVNYDEKSFSSYSRGEEMPSMRSPMILETSRRNSSRQTMISSSIH